MIRCWQSVYCVGKEEQCPITYIKIFQRDEISIKEGYKVLTLSKLHKIEFSSKEKNTPLIDIGVTIGDKQCINSNKLPKR